ncbi:MAG: UDP-galactopyranose mutase [Asticcacaulis sp.]
MAQPASTGALEPVICFSHLRWDFVLQRPQHLMQRYARHRRVYVFEELIPTDHHLPYLELHSFDDTEVVAVRPRVPAGFSAEERLTALRGLLTKLMKQIGAKKPLLWFYTPMMWPIAEPVAGSASAIVYDCMDELSAFKFAPPELKANEAALMNAADVVFTGGYSIWEAKRGRHDNIHPFPSSVDVAHFATARKGVTEPADQAVIPHPRIGFYGVIDERLDLGLIEAMADRMPETSIVMLGPVVKISEADLPRRPNLYYLGQKTYAELPAYVSGWDVALMPFAINEATRFISPTKTPEYLAAGRPVVSTPIRDVVRHYGDLEGVMISADADQFISNVGRALELAMTDAWLAPVDALLASQSWDNTFNAMRGHIDRVAAAKSTLAPVDRFSAPGIRRKSKKPYDVVIAGAGFAGSVLAERLAEGSGLRVLVCDKRPHVGGNAYDHRDAAGIMVHKYGPHIFHTNSDEIVKYLSRFTEWRPYEHRVLADLNAFGIDKRLPIPINRDTLNGLYGLDLKDDEAAAAFLATQAEPVDKITTSRDVVINQVGRKLYETFFEGYTRKQWGLDPSQLDKSVTARIPTRTSIDDRYFLDSFQAMPLHGYTRMFERMLDHENIDLALGTDYNDLSPQDLAPLTVYTGPIDEYFGHRFGKLPYRSLDFVHQTLDQRRFQEVAVVNYPSQAVPYTRITEYKHLTGQVHQQTSISYEYSKAEGDPYYPVPRPENQALYKQYEELAAKRDDVIFVGRLGTYKYYNMDQVVAQSLATYRRLAPRLSSLTGALTDDMSQVAK